MSRENRARATGKSFVFLCAGLVVALIVALLSGFSSTATATAAPPKAVVTSVMPGAMLLPAHRVRTRMAVKVGTTYWWGGYAQVKLNRSQSYAALKRYRSAASGTRDAGIFICALFATASPYAAAACMAVFLISAGDVRAMMRGVAGNHHRCVQVRVWANGWANNLKDNFKAPYCRRR